MKEALKNVVFFVAGIAVIFAVMSFFGIDKVITEIVKTDLSLFLIAGVLQIAILGLLGLRLKVLSGYYPAFKIKKAFEVSLIGSAVSLITPFARIGGEPVKIKMIKPIFGISRSAAVIVLDLVAEVLSLYAVIVFAIILILAGGYVSFGAMFPFLVLFGISFVLIIVFMLISRNVHLLRKFIGFFQRLISRFKEVEDKDYAKLFCTSMDMLVSNRKSLWGTIVISASIRILEFARLWLIFVALGSPVSIFVIVMAWSLIVLIGMIPWLPGGLGLIEAGGTGAFILFGVATGVAAGAMILDRFLSFWLVVFLGLVWLWRKKGEI